MKFIVKRKLTHNLFLKVNIASVKRVIDFNQIILVFFSILLPSVLTLINLEDKRYM